MATATIPIAPPPTAAATEQATRIVELALLLTAAADARNIRAKHQLTEELIAAGRELPVETVIPVPHVLEPVDRLEREIDNEHGYKIRIEDGHLVLLAEDADELVALTFDATSARQLIADLARVLAFVEANRG